MGKHIAAIQGHPDASGRRKNVAKVRSPYYLDLRRRPSDGLIIWSFSIPSGSAPCRLAFEHGESGRTPMKHLTPRLLSRCSSHGPGWRAMRWADGSIGSNLPGITMAASGANSTGCHE